MPVIRCVIIVTQRFSFGRLGVIACSGMTRSILRLAYLLRLSTLAKEPLLHFLVAAGLLWLACRGCGHPEVQISVQALNGLRNDFAAAIGRRPSQPEVKHLVAEYLDDEILYREALRSGLTQDPKVRALLIQAMRASLQPVVPEPTDAELVATRERTPAVYRYPATLSFEHVSFTNSTRIPDELLKKLHDGASPQGLGDALDQVANPLPPTFRPQLEDLLGVDFISALSKCRLGKWEGPLTSTRGVHFVRLVNYEAERDMPMADIRASLIASWSEHKQAELISNKISQLRKAYCVTIPPVFPEIP